jgi:hypothetical protein
MLIELTFLRNSDLEMGNGYIVPVLLQIFEREPSMAMLCGRLAAQQDRLPLEAVLGERRLHLSGPY